MKKLESLLVIFIAFLALSSCSFAQNDELKSKTVTVGERPRVYYIHVPPRLPRQNAAPLVIVFHGGGGNGAGTAGLTKFNEIADKEDFIAVYPNGVGGNWNDGREDMTSAAYKEKVDDLAFVKALLDDIAKENKIDTKRIYATGISNGAIFSHYIGANLADRFAAIAPVVGGIADPFYKSFKPTEPVSVLMINGTSDPLIPFDGGNVTKKGRGKIIGTMDAVRLWLKTDKIDEESAKTVSSDADENDPCTVDQTIWTGGGNKTEVVLYKLNGGGHTWPGGIQYMPRLIIGDVCRDIDATKVIWEFFKQHPKVQKSSRNDE